MHQYTIPGFKQRFSVAQTLLIRVILEKKARRKAKHLWQTYYTSSAKWKNYRTSRVRARKLAASKAANSRLLGAVQVHPRVCLGSPPAAVRI
jgi:hypothetical protein